jgi:hypothetical protein
MEFVVDFTSPSFRAIDGLEQLERAPLSAMPAAVERATTGEEQVIFLHHGIKSLAKALLELHYTFNAKTKKMELLSWHIRQLHATMAEQPVGSKDWRFGLQCLRNMLDEQRKNRGALQHVYDAMMRRAQCTSNGIHAEFALPMVERTTGLPPGIVALLGPLLSTHCFPDDYVSIHALHDASQHSEQEGW